MATLPSSRPIAGLYAPGFAAGPPRAIGVSGWLQHVSSGWLAFTTISSEPQLSQRNRVPAFVSTGWDPPRSVGSM
jgi:hypothetical protein